MSDQEEDGYQLRVKSPPPQPPPTPNKGHRQAWDESTKVEVSIAPDETEPQADRHPSVPPDDKEKKPHHSMPIIEQIMNLDDGLNVKGKI